VLQQCRTAAFTDPEVIKGESVVVSCGTIGAICDPELNHGFILQDIEGVPCSFHSVSLPELLKLTIRGTVHRRFSRRSGNRYTSESRHPVLPEPSRFSAIRAVLYGSPIAIKIEEPPNIHFQHGPLAPVKSKQGLVTHDCSRGAVFPGI